MKLNESWDTFKLQLDEFIKEGNELNKTNVETEIDINDLREKFKDFSKRCFTFLQNSFEGENNEYAYGFYNEHPQRFHISGTRKDFAQLKKEIFEDIKAKTSILPYYKKILSISDVITKPELLELQERDKYSTEQILELILDKLYELYDNHYHSISTILNGNGIIIKRHGEEREYLKTLENLGYVKVMHVRDVVGQLTLNGKMYVEEKRKSYKENYDDISSDKELIGNIIDEVLAELKKVGIGQEILFEELQELKELYSKLNKKNWGQIVKGKLIDLALSKLVENDTISYIYEKLTSHHLRLP